MITAADLIAGAVMPIRLSLNVRIRPGSRDGQEAEPAPPSAPRRPRRRAESDAQIVEQAARLREWTKESPDNARLVLFDPAEAVARAGVELPAEDLRVLRRRVRERRAADVLPAGVELVGFSVEFSADPAPRRRASGAAPERRASPAEEAGQRGSGRTGGNDG